MEEPRPSPDLDDVREALREHDERQEQEPPPAEPEGDDDDSTPDDTE
jgi:hypothetical protein